MSYLHQLTIDTCCASLSLTLSTPPTLLRTGRFLKEIHRNSTLCLVDIHVVFGMEKYMEVSFPMREEVKFASSDTYSCSGFRLLCSLYTQYTHPFLLIPVVGVAGCLSDNLSKRRHRGRGRSRVDARESGIDRCSICLIQESATSGLAIQEPATSRYVELPSICLSVLFDG